MYITTALCIWVFALSLVHLLRYSDSPENGGRGFHGAVSKYPASLVCMIYTLLAFLWAPSPLPPSPPLFPFSPPPSPALPARRKFAMHDVVHASLRSKDALKIFRSQSSLSRSEETSGFVQL